MGGGIKNTATGSQKYHRFCADNDNATSSAVKQAKETPPPKRNALVFLTQKFINSSIYNVTASFLFKLKRQGRHFLGIREEKVTALQEDYKK